MLGGWKVEGVSELSDLILQSAAGAGILLFMKRCAIERDIAFSMKIFPRRKNILSQP